MAQSELPEKTATYQFGHQPAVKNSLSRKAVQNARCLLPHIKPPDEFLDAGCGPRSITLDFAVLVLGDGN